MTDSERRRQRRKYVDLADQLQSVSGRPEYAGRKWTWIDIAVALNVTTSTAHNLILWMRKNYTEMYWTVGTFATEYKSEPTRLVSTALAGMLNQQAHIVSRMQTMARSWETLARIDPDESWRALATDNAEHFRSILVQERTFRDLLDRKARDLGWVPPVRELVDA